MNDRHIDVSLLSLFSSLFPSVFRHLFVEWNLRHREYHGCQCSKGADALSMVEIGKESLLQQGAVTISKRRMGKALLQQECALPITTNATCGNVMLRPWKKSFFDHLLSKPTNLVLRNVQRFTSHLNNA